MANQLQRANILVQARAPSQPSASRSAWCGEEPDPAQAMDALLRKRWSLLDFGSLQFLWDCISGEYIKVYGAGAIRVGGPWRLAVSNGSGKVELLPIDDGEGGAMKLDPEELASVKVRRSEGDGKLMVVDKRQAMRPHEMPLGDWRDDNACNEESKGIVLEVTDFPLFECVCTWLAVPQLCGDKPVCMWLDFPWFVNYVYGKEAVDFVFRYAGYLKEYLQKLGLHESHISESARSLASKRRRMEDAEQEEEGKEEDCSSPGTSSKMSQWRVSMLGAALFLEAAACSKSWTRAAFGHKDSDARAKALMTALMKWAKHGEPDVAFVLPRTGCQLLLMGGMLTVDRESLVQSEGALDTTRSRLSSLVEAGGTFFFDMLAERRQRLRYRGRMKQVWIDRLETFLVDIVECFADLCETTRAMPEWSDKDVLDLGVLTTAKGRCRNIPSSYKSSVVREVRVSGGMSGKTVSALVLGMSRAARVRGKGSLQVKRKKGWAAKMATRLAARSAKSQFERGHPDAPNFQSRVKKSERSSYFLSGQRLAAKERRLSLALDATDVSYKKTLNATMCLPRIERALWLPPMDLGGPQGLPSILPPISCPTWSLYPCGPHLVCEWAPCGATREAIGEAKIPEERL